MPIRVTCPKCHTRFNVSEKFAGKEGPCPKCKTVIQVPRMEDQVVIAEPTTKGPIDTTGQAVLKPIKRKETKLSSVQITLIVSLVMVFLLLALVMRSVFPTAQEHPWWLLILSAIVLAPPLVFASYAFLRDQDREGFVGRTLWIRVAACSAIFAITWAAFPIAYFAFNDSYETGSYLAATIAMFAAGTVASIACFEFDWILGAVQFGLYVGVGILGRWLAGLGALPMTPVRSGPSGNGTQPTAWLENWDQLGLPWLDTLQALLMMG